MDFDLDQFPDAENPAWVSKYEFVPLKDDSHLVKRKSKEFSNKKLKEELESKTNPEPQGPEES